MDTIALLHFFLALRTSEFRQAALAVRRNTGRIARGDPRSRVPARSASAGLRPCRQITQGSTPRRSAAGFGRLEDELGLAFSSGGRFGVRLTAGRPGGDAPRKGVLTELDAVKRAGSQNGTGGVGHIRLGVRMPADRRASGSLLALAPEPSERGATVLEMTTGDLPRR